jgi:hypothetical protein
MEPDHLVLERPVVRGGKVGLCTGEGSDLPRIDARFREPGVREERIPHPGILFTGSRDREQ